ncbi:MAG: malonyl-CoA synthase [Rhizobiaceae bacterium]
MANHLYDKLFRQHENSSVPFLIRDNGQVVTYGEFLRLAARFAHAARAAGVGTGDRIAVQVKKSPEALATYAACVMAGAVFLPLNTAYTASEVEYFVTDAGAKLLVCDTGSVDRLMPVATKVGARLMSLDGNGAGTFVESAATHPSDFAVVDREADDLAAFLYTSGTTGRSKGAMLSHDNLLSNAVSLVEYWQFSSADVLLHALPIFHTHGLFVATNVMLLAGGSMIFLPGLDMDKMFEFMPRATTMMGVPTFYTRLLADSRLTRDAVSHMRLFISGSAPLLAETHTEFENRTGHRILERYGMTETNMNTSNPHDGERRAGTVGFPLPGVEVRIANPETGQVLPAGEIGVLEIRGRNVFKGYWNMPEKTAEEFRADGFFITGDLATMDGEGYVTIVGRAKDLIISGGYNIYPKEIELILDEQPGVDESAVVGIAHPDFGEAVVAVVVPAKGAELSADALMAAMQDNLARFKQPKKIFVVDELPRNTMGKVQKNVLRTRFADIFG